MLDDNLNSTYGPRDSSLLQPLPSMSPNGKDVAAKSNSAAYGVLINPKKAIFDVFTVQHVGTVYIPPT